MANPPLWLLRQTILPYGARLQKNKPKWEEPKKPIYTSGFGRVGPSRPLWDRKTGETTWWENGKQYRFNFTTQKPELIESKEPPQIGNLDNGEYFKWIGREHKSMTFATCRACGFVAMSKDQRRDHGECGKLLTEAYRLLRKDKKPDGGYICVVCDSSTPNLSWGVPVCFTCKDTWRFGRGGMGRLTLSSLTYAIDMAKSNMGIK